MTIGADQRAVQVWDDDGGRIPSEKVGNDIRGWITDIASSIASNISSWARSEAVDVTKNAARLTRRFPLQIFAGALVLGFVIGRVRR